MKQIDLTLYGVTSNWASGNYNQLFVTVAVASCVVHHKNDTKCNFSNSPLVTVSIEPFRHLPIGTKHALITRGSEVVLHVTGTMENPQTEVVSVKERTDRPLEDFLEALEKA